MKKGMREVLLALTLSLIMFSFGYILGNRRTSPLKPSPAGYPRVRMEAPKDFDEIEEGTLTFYKILEREKGNPSQKEARGSVSKKSDGKAKERNKGIEAVSEDRYSIQVSSYRTRVKAFSHLQALKREGYQNLYITVVEIDGKGRWYRLRCGPFDNKEEAQKIAEKMGTGSGRKVYVVKLD